MLSAALEVFMHTCSWSCWSLQTPWNSSGSSARRTCRGLRSLGCNSIGGLVVEYMVAIDQLRQWLATGAWCFFLFSAINFEVSHINGPNAYARNFTVINFQGNCLHQI